MTRPYNNITRAILELRIKYAKRFKISPAQINSGLCMDFAADIVKMGFGEDVWGSEILNGYWSEAMMALEDNDFNYIADCHCFIAYNGKFYDSEMPQGCDYPDQLPCYQRNIDLID